MKKIATPGNSNLDRNSDPTLALADMFWRWFSVSVFALLLAAAIPALSADVFIDEGDGDFGATPVTASPAPIAVNAPPAIPTSGGKAPASTDIPPAGPGEIDLGVSELEPSSGESPSDKSAGGEAMGTTNEQKMNDLMAAPPKAETQAKKTVKKTTSSKKVAKATGKNHAKKIAKNSAKKTDKKSNKKKSTASKVKKKSKKTAEYKAVTKKVVKKSTKVSAGKKSSKRKVASVSNFAGGQYATSSRSCPLESSPGAGDSNGMTKASRKLWVEDSGNTSYYKVFVKGGTAAFVAKDCF
jgi:hypothetical protein